MAKNTFKNGVIFFVFKKDKILLEQRKDVSAPLSGYTIIPGGGIEFGEEPEQTLMRETKEECGIEVKEYQKIGEMVNPNTQGVLITRYLYLIKRYTGRIRNVENRNKHILITLTEARRICVHPLSQQALDLLDAFTEKESKAG